MLSEPFSAAPAAGFPSTKHKRLGTEVKHLIACPFLFLQANYYRPQSSDTCYPCDCFPSGSHTRSCDMETGQCPCKPGVIGRQCNRCDNPFAEVTARGCEGTAQPDTLPSSGGVGSGGSGEMGCGEGGVCGPMHVLCHASHALCLSSLPLLPCLSAHPPSSCHQHKAAAAVIALQCVGETTGKGFPTRKEWAEIRELRCRAP